MGIADSQRCANVHQHPSSSATPAWACTAAPALPAPPGAGVGAVAAAGPYGPRTSF